VTIKPLDDALTEEAPLPEATALVAALRARFEGVLALSSATVAPSDLRLGGIVV
jgi:hypothetical protein